MKEDQIHWSIGLDIIWFLKELLTDPNEGLTDTEIRLGRQVRKVKVSSSSSNCYRSGRQNVNLGFNAPPFKVLSSKEKKDQRMILGDHYQDKEFLRQECWKILCLLFVSGVLFVLSKISLW